MPGVSKAPRAQLVYSDSFAIHVDEAELNEPLQTKAEDDSNLDGINEKVQLIKKFAYHTHYNQAAEAIYSLGEIILSPTKAWLNCLATAIKPDAGENKGRWLRNGVVRIGALLGFACLTPFVLPSTLLGFAFRAMSHFFRPAYKVVKSPIKTQIPTLSEVQGLDEILCENTGLVPSFMSTVGDLRSPAERAHERIRWHNAEEKHPPIQILLETFSRDANKILVEGFQKDYPYIIHHVAPHISGLNSGVMILSMYPIKSFHFHKFAGMKGPEKLSPRGAAVLRIPTTAGDFEITAVHTQALPGKTRAEARLKQIRFAKRIQGASDAPFQLLAGDTNTSYVSAWNQFNYAKKKEIKDKNVFLYENDSFEDVLEDEKSSDTAIKEKQHIPAEQPTLDWVSENFKDAYLNDHNQLGERTKGEARWIEQDKKTMRNLGMNPENVKEPIGSWRKGPFNTMPFFMRLENFWNRIWNGVPPLANVPNDDLAHAPGSVESAPVAWGTPEWQKTQVSKPTRFDQFQQPIHSKPKIFTTDAGKVMIVGEERDPLPLDVKVEIRNRGCSNPSSAISDHNAICAQVRLHSNDRAPQRQPVPLQRAEVIDRLEDYISKVEAMKHQEYKAGFVFAKVSRAKNRLLNCDIAKLFVIKLKTTETPIAEIFSEQNVKSDPFMVARIRTTTTSSYSIRSSELMSVIEHARSLKV